MEERKKKENPRFFKMDQLEKDPTSSENFRICSPKSTFHHRLKKDSTLVKSLQLHHNVLTIEGPEDHEMGMLYSNP